LCCPAPSVATTARSATLPAASDFPGLTGYTPTRSPRPQRGGRGGLPQFLRPPSDRSTPHTPAGSLALHSRLLAPSVAFAVTHPARLPLVPEGCRNQAAGFASCCGPVGCSHHRGFRRCASTPGVSPQRRQPATGLPGDYPDRTPTGWRTQACGHTRFTPRASPPPGPIAHALWARCAAGTWR
jgi:hypothetical protein